MEPSFKENLDAKIWTTRKCRINATERLLASAKFVEFINVYYSIFIILLSLLAYVKKSEQISLAALILSIALTVSIIYANSTGLKERSATLKKNYIDLQALHNRLLCTDAKDKDKLLSISDEYTELLRGAENHIFIDHYKVRVETSKKLTWKDHLKWFGLCMRSIFLKLCLIAIPILVIACLVFKVIEW